MKAAVSLASALAQALAVQLMEGGPPVLLLYPGLAPTSPEDEPATAPLAVLQYSVTVTGAVVSLSQTATAAATAAGTASWARLASGAGAPIYDLTIGVDLLITDALLAVGTQIYFADPVTLRYA